MDHRSYMQTGVAQGLNVAADTPPAHALEDVHRQLGEITKTAQMNADRTQRVIDRAFGAKPSAESNTAKPREVRSGTVGALLDLLIELQAAVAWQSRTVDELDRLT